MLLDLFTQVGGWVESSKLKKKKKELKALKKAEKENSPEDTGEEKSLITEKSKKQKDIEKDITKSKFKILLNKIVSAIISAVEHIIIYVTAMITSMTILIVLAFLIILLTLFLVLQKFDTGGKTSVDMPPPQSSQQTQGNSSSGNAMYGAVWTLEELAVRGSLLSDYEKNLYRAVVLCKQTVDGTFNNLKWGTDLAQAQVFLLGVISMESSMKFYTTADNGRNILVDQSDKGHNPEGYGLFGMKYTSKMVDYYVKAERDKINALYPPVGNVPVEINHSPYGIAMAGAHLQKKMTEIVWKGPTTDAVIEKVMDSYGVVANRDKLKVIIEWCLGEAQYHGAEKVEYPAYAGFITAMWCATSDVDAERDFAKWSFSDGTPYDESSVRHCFTGSKGAQDVEKTGDFTNMTFKSYQSTRPTINGKALDKPIWGYLHDKYYGKNEYFTIAEKQLLDFASSVTNESTSGWGMRVLNFHYGVNAYMQGTRVMQGVASKLTGEPVVNTPVTIVPGEFKETPGVGQGVWEGKTIEACIDEYLKTHSGMTSYMRGLSKYFGMAKHIKPGESVAGTIWKQGKYNTPFYLQIRTTDEEYGLYEWYPNTQTYKASGCMVYAHAYAASSMTGRLINPPEMGAMMIMKGALTSGGAVKDCNPAVYKALGLNAKVLYDIKNNWNTVWPQLNDCLSSGGIAVVRAFGEPYATAGSNHFFVLTGVTKVGNENMYSMYSSSSVSQTNELQSESKLKKYLHLDVTLITK